MISAVQNGSSPGPDPVQGAEKKAAPGGLRFRPDIEGLRAIAIGMVVLSHLGAPGFGSGFIGVDVFFVISGFLITSLFVCEYANNAGENGGRGSLSIRAFYRRRVYRILPAALTTIGVVLVAGKLLLGKIAFIKLQADALWATFFGTNIQLVRQAADYFQVGLPDSPLQNYWSLAVEEQFYIVWPACFALVAWLMYRAGKNRWLFGVKATVILIALASFALSVTWASTDPAANYFSTATRAWQLALGALLALSPSIGSRVTHASARILGIVGAALLAASLIWCGNGTSYPGWLGLLPTLGAVLLIAAGLNPEVKHPIGSILSRREPRALGRISYSLYLWHWPIIVFAALLYGNSSKSLAFSVLLLCLSVGVAALSYVVIEKPFIRLGHRSRSGSSLPESDSPARRAAMAAVVVFATCSIGLLARPLPTVSDNLPTAGPMVSKADWMARLNASTKHLSLTSAQKTLASRMASFQVSSGESDPQEMSVGELRSCESTMTVTSLKDALSCTSSGRGAAHLRWPTDRKRSVLLAGNSFAGQWYNELRSLLPRNVRLTPLTITSCRPWVVGGKQRDAHGNSCAEHASLVLRTIRRLHPGLTIVSYQRSKADSGQNVATAALIRRMRMEGTEVLFLGPAPSVPSFAKCLESPLGTVSCNRLLNSSDWRAEVKLSKAVQSSGGSYLNIQRLVCGLKVCPSFIGSRPSHRDGIHLSRWTTRGISVFVIDAIRHSISSKH